MLWKQISTGPNYICQRWNKQNFNVRLDGPTLQRNMLNMKCILEDRYEGITVKISNKKIPTERIYMIHHQSSLQGGDKSLVWTSKDHVQRHQDAKQWWSLQGGRNFEPCACQENVHDCGAISSTTHLWDWKIYEHLKISEFCEQNMNLQDLPYSNDRFLKLTWV